MNYLKLFSFLILCLSSVSRAATFIPISYDEQIRKADAIIHAKFKGKSYKKIGEGDVVTVNSFVLEGSSGISHSDLINKNSFKIISPGGVWDNRTYKFSGSPEFRVGEEVVLFLKKTPSGYQVNNLSLGKYSIVEEGQEKYIKNSVFPEHPRMKPIKLKNLQEKLSQLGKEEIKLLDQRKSYVVEDNDNDGNGGGNKRSPASFAKTQQNKEGEKDSPFGLYALFALLAIGGLLFRYVSKKFT